MRDNNIEKKIVIVPSKQIIVAKKLVCIRKYGSPKTTRIPNRENVKRNGHSQMTTETITARSSQSIKKYFNNISTTRERKNVQITDGKKTKKKRSDLSTITLHRVTRRNTTKKNEPTDDPT